MTHAVHPSLEHRLPRRTIKLGGSLLDMYDLLPRFRRWLAAQPASENLLVVGGGKMADAIRDADRLHGLGEAAAHDLCIRVMSVQAEMMAHLLGEAVLVRRLREHWPTALVPRLAIVDPSSAEGVGALSDTVPVLPASWEVTSDSIAAHVAKITASQELVLLKSALIDAPHSIAHAIDAGYVDRYFATIAGRHMPVRCVNLRAEGFPEAQLIAD